MTMPTKNKKFLLKKLGNKETVELSRSEVYRIVENESEIVDLTIQQLLLNEVEIRKNELMSYLDFNYDYMHQALSSGELTSKELTYLLITLFGGDH